MKKPWLIPVVVCAVLLLAWPFRWEKGPVQDYKTYTVRHVHDRWTGDDWVYEYSYNGVIERPSDVSANRYLIVIPPLWKDAKYKAERAVLEAKYNDLRNKLEIAREKFSRSSREKVVFAERELQEAEQALQLLDYNYSEKHSTRLLDAYGRRNLATGIWAVLVVASGLWAWRLYARRLD